MPSHLLPVLAKQGLGGVLRSLVPDVCVFKTVSCSSLTSTSLFGPQSSNSSSSSMLLQNRHVAATGAAAPAAADNGTVRRTPLKVQALTSKKGSKASSSPGSARAAAGVPEHKVLKAVPGMGKVYLERLQAQGISSLDKLAENILAQLTREDAQEAFSPGVKYLQVCTTAPGSVVCQAGSYQVMQAMVAGISASTGAGHSTCATRCRATHPVVGLCLGL